VPHVSVVATVNAKLKTFDMHALRKAYSAWAVTKL
jgi:hypothetical protein